MRKSLFLAAVATALFSAVLSVPAPASAGAGAGGPILGPCSDAPKLPPRARCGSIQVPLDRSNPDLGTIAIAFALVPRLDTSQPTLGTIVPNPGGPGVAAISGAEAPDPDRFAPLLDRRDLLLVDPRGTGRSGALECRALGQYFLFASRTEQLARIGACARELGPRVGLYGTAAVADDIEAVRAALGLERLDLWGDSYGTYLMPVYAARHPEHVRSLVLSGAGPIDFDPWGRDKLDAARRALRLVCARTGACRGQALLDGVARLADRLRRNPIELEIVAGVRRFPAILDEGALAELVFASGQAAAYGRIPAAVASALDGDLAPLRRLFESNTLVFAASLTDPSFSLAQNFATHCHDYPRVFSYADGVPDRYAAYDAALAALDPDAFWPFTPVGWTLTGEADATCLEWPDDPTAGSPLPPGTPFADVPVLVLSGDLDANAPSAAGRQAAAQFRRGTFVEIPNAGHTPVAYSACALDLALRFIATFEVNPRRVRAGGDAAAGRRHRSEACIPAPSGRGRGRQAQRAPGAGSRPRDSRRLARAGRGARGLGQGEGASRRELRRPAGRHDPPGRREDRAGRPRVRRSRGRRGRQPRRDAAAGGSGVPTGRLRVRLAPDGSGRAAGVLGGRAIDWRSAWEVFTQPSRAAKANKRSSDPKGERA